MKTNPIVDELWRPFNRKFAKDLRAHRAKFLPDDEFTCDTLAKVVQQSVEGDGLPLRTVVRVVRVDPPRQSEDLSWRHMRRPYVSATILVDDVERTCNLESLEPV